ncbi:restriction endonuclease subunit S [Pseudomonas kielensis]|uniref:restriction endonuclease subunit S n=1 Tax=Pseudomonas kielensis TaxID=2762577 RepID=UPI00223F576B|nr:restriction endonuclease subunit S [Pseudomonas kielensis]UZM12933.1 restriction endonuclease subunit S [Pseudomonas kielensis]
MSFPAYPEYKDSGVEWLGKVPEHWSVHPLKRAIAKIESGTSVNAADYPAESGSYGVLKTSCVYTGQFDWRENKTVDDEDLNRVSCPLKIDTLVVSRMNTPDLVGATGLVTEAPDGIFLPDRLWQVYFEPSQSPSFIFYFTKSSEYREQVKNACSGTSSSMQNLGQDDFRTLLFVEPPVAEQTQIARFLDHESVRIDALIEKQQRLIELLKEKRQAVISQAVTKGLDSTVPMNDSGVEWLGEVPAHWVVRKVSVDFLASKGPRGALLTKEYCHDNFGKYPVYSGQTENGGILGKIADFDFDLGADGAILSTTVGAKAMSVLHIQGRISLSQNCMIIKPMNRSVSVRFFFYHFQPLFSLERRMIPDHMQPSFRMEDLYSFKVAVPPESEQIQISEYLDAAISRFDELISVGNSGIALLDERRSALISAAVTGKIDVSSWQPVASAPSHELELEAL